VYVLLLSMLLRHDVPVRLLRQSLQAVVQARQAALQLPAAMARQALPVCSCLTAHAGQGLLQRVAIGIPILHRAPVILPYAVLFVGAAMMCAHCTWDSAVRALPRSTPPLEGAAGAWQRVHGSSTLRRACMDQVPLAAGCSFGVHALQTSATRAHCTAWTLHAWPG
jgi:hypothetical protein